MVFVTIPSECPPPPDRTRLREVALAHLARFAATRHDLEQVLFRRVARWERAALKAGVDRDDLTGKSEALRDVIKEVAADMVRLGAVNDEDYARARARRLVRSGRSGKAVQAHLASHGVDAPLREAALEGAVESFSAQETELAAALVLARKRRLGPFASLPRLNSRVTAQAEDDGPQAEQAMRHKALGVFARSGFGHDVARRVLDMEAEEAEEWTERLRAES